MAEGNLREWLENYLMGHKLNGDSEGTLDKVSQLENKLSNNGIFDGLLQRVREQIKKLKETNEEIVAAFDSSYDGIWITDGKGKTLRVNKAIERITGLSSEEVIGKYMTDLVDQGFFDVSATLKVLASKKQITIMQKTVNGTQNIVTGTPIFDEKGEISRVISNTRDITDLNLLKQQLNQAKEEIVKLKTKYGNHNRIVYSSNVMQRIIDTASRVSHFNTTVLLLGESGVGKEVIAEFIHESSKAKDGPFICVNCGALPDNLLESELFGYEAGAFTGASPRGKPGMFELADNGTLLLDEIGDVPLNLQVKLLRVLQEDQVLRLGSTTPVKVNVRVIAATNHDLEQMVKNNTFRKDLYYRLNVLPITIPPLRDRKEDVAVLLNHYLKHFNTTHGINKKLAPEVIKELINYSWPGNVRELKNMVEYLTIIASESVIRSEDLPSQLLQKEIHYNKGGSLGHVLAQVEKDIIVRVMDKYKSTYKAAKALGISQSSIVRKCQKYGYNR